jgi:hypothetical protein
MPQLPRACSKKYTDLQHAIPDSFRVRRLTQVSEIRLSLPLVLLLSSNIFEFLVQITELAAEFAYVATVALDIRLRTSYHNVEIELDVRA